MMKTTIVLKVTYHIVQIPNISQMLNALRAAAQNESFQMITDNEICFILSLILKYQDSFTLFGILY